jgi:hypothetical protein
LADDAVRLELVWGGKFPAIRENSRDFSEIRRMRAGRTGNSARYFSELAKVCRCSEFFRRDQGRSFDEQAAFARISMPGV